MEGALNGPRVEVGPKEPKKKRNRNDAEAAATRHVKAPAKDNSAAIVTGGSVTTGARAD